MIDIRVFTTHPHCRVRHQDVLQLAHRVLRGEHHDQGALNIIFVGDPMMKKMNTKYLHHRYATDVLAFLLGGTKNTIDGEMYVNMDQARRQAREYRVTFSNEIQRLVIHGILHLVGYTDATKMKRQRMTQTENRYLRHS
jgi:probable rRNA maturation factor